MITSAHPQTALGTGVGASELPADLVAASARRLMWTLLILVGADLFYFLLFNTVWSEYGTRTGRILTVIVTCILALHIFYLRSCAQTRRQVVSLGVSTLLIVCFTLTLVELSAFQPYERPLPGIPWYSVLIVLFAFIIPASPRTMVVWSVIAATMGPVAFAFGAQLDLVPPIQTDVIVAFFLPPFVCAFVALAPARAMSKLSGEVGKARRLGAYELVERVGHGGMGEVWRARHFLLSRPAAVKLIRPEVVGARDSAAVRDLKARFEREAQTTALLESRHTVALYDFGVSSEGVFYYVMELLDGVDLEALVTEFGPVPAERAVHFLIGVCDSLDDAHSRGLIHRDIKPANIVAARKGRHYDIAKVLDFGLVKGSVQEQVDIRATGETILKGTPAYVAPESVTGNREVDTRADLYAVGCVGYWLLTGHLVFEAADSLGMAVAHASEKPTPPSKRTETAIPAALDALIMKCLEKNPDDRPQTALELSQALESVELDQPWTEERATRWWSLHKPQPRADEAGPSARPTILRPASR